MEDLVERAKHFAIEAHKEQIRSGRVQRPFIVHPAEVALLVRESGGNDEEISAAWLHDAVEDTPATLDDIVKLFGESVADIVDGLTDPAEFAGMPLLERKELQAGRIRSMSNSIKRVKIADQTSNVRSIAVDPPEKWSKDKCLDYIVGARLIVVECQGVSEFLNIQFSTAYTDALEVHR